jgi:DGQHR domain-containing protein
MTETKRKLIVKVVRSNVLGLEVVRGYARLCDLALISRPDIYDAKTNPTGTQRDLSPKHARDAYEYVQNEQVGFFPEIFLALRDRSVCKFTPFSRSETFGEIQIDPAKVESASEIKISRVDGNHRLHFADGLTSGFPPIEKTVSFCLATDITKEQEIKLFRDINNNQRRMNTSHLDNIKLRLAGEDLVAVQDPPLYIANRLKNDKDSPFQSKVYDGGRSDVTKFIPLRTLKTALEYMFSRPTRLTALDDVKIQTLLVKNYLGALKSWQPQAWDHPQDYLLLRGAGLWGAFFLGAEIIDKALAKGKYKAADMLAILRSGPQWDWSKNGPFKGFSGRAGAVRIRDLIVAELDDGSGGSLKSLVQKISQEL